MTRRRAYLAASYRTAVHPHPSPHTSEFERGGQLACRAVASQCIIGIDTYLFSLLHIGVQPSALEVRHSRVELTPFLSTHRCRLR
jgi:hypothetical protein